VVPEAKSPLDRALDLFVFAPLGLAMTARTQLPDMVATGRAQVEGQLTLARFIGQFAVKQGTVEVGKRLRAYTDRSARGQSDRPSAEPDRMVGDTAPATAPPGPVDPAPSQGASTTGAADLAIPGYGALSASQVVQRLAGLSSIELEQVRLYETATRGRKTVLTKISQLQ